MRNDYLKAVQKCKLLVERRNSYKYEIVKIALGVCVIKEGNNGAHRNYTLTAFAKDIGVAKGTLSRWKLEYENVVVKLKDGGKNKHALNQTMKRVDSSTTKKDVQKLYEKYSTGYKTREDKTFRTYTDRLRSMHFFICHSVELSKMDKETLAEFKGYIKGMSETLNTGVQKKITKPDGDTRKAREMLGGSL